MSTGEGEDPRNGQARRDGDERRGERIGVGGGDDSVSRIQLAARWAEAYGGDNDSLRGVLHRFRAAYDYLDAVIHGVEPTELDSEADEARASGPAPSGYSSIPSSEPAPAWREQQTQPQPPAGQAAPSPWAPPTQPEPVPPPPWAPPTQPEPGGPPSEPRPWG